MGARWGDRGRARAQIPGARPRGAVVVVVAVAVAVAVVVVVVVVAWFWGGARGAPVFATFVVHGKTLVAKGFV